MRDKIHQCYFGNLIAGNWTPPVKFRYMTLAGHNGDIYVPRSCALDIGQALIAARAAESHWLALPEKERASYLWDLAYLMEIYQAEFLDLNSCTTITNASKDTLESARTWLRECGPAYVPVRQRAVEPVLGKIFLAGNENIASAFQCIAPALVSGMTVVVAVLHREENPLFTQLLSFLEFSSQCLPAGVLNLVYGLGIEVGVPLLNDRKSHSVEIFQPACLGSEQLQERKLVPSNRRQQKTSSAFANSKEKHK